MGFGLSGTEVICNVHAAQSDGLASSLQQLLHQYISFTCIAAVHWAQPFGVFYISLSIDLAAGSNRRFAVMHRQAIDGTYLKGDL